MTYFLGPSIGLVGLNIPVADASGESATVLTPVANRAYGRHDSVFIQDWETTGWFSISGETVSSTNVVNGSARVVGISVGISLTEETRNARCSAYTDVDRFDITVLREDENAS